MRKMWGTAVAVLVAGMLMLSGCGNSESSSDSEQNGNGDANKKDKTEKVTVGMTQIVEHPSLDAASKGFKKGMADSGYKAGENVSYKSENAQNDKANAVTIAKSFVSDKVDLIFANSTPSAQSAVNATDEIPIVFTSVSDPVGSELVDSMDNPGGNVTGTTDTHPDAIPKMVTFIAEQFDNIDTVGMIYNSGESNSVTQVDRAEKAMKDTDLELEKVTVSNDSEVLQAAKSLVGRADAIYIITDNTVVSALDSVLKVGYNNEIPVFVGELDSVKKGGLAAYGFSYEDIGYQTGKMAAKILKGDKQPKDIPVAYPDNLKLLINKDAAKKMGVEIKPEWDDMAEYYKK